MDTGTWACLCNLVYAKMSKILDKFKILVKLQKHQRKFGIFAQDFYSSENRYLRLEIPKEKLTFCMYESKAAWQHPEAELSNLKSREQILTTVTHRGHKPKLYFKFTSTALAISSLSPSVTRGWDSSGFASLHYHTTCFCSI